MEKSETLRRKMVAKLEQGRAIRSDAVREAFLAVPRELFIPEVESEQGLGAVYSDQAFATKADAHGMPISSSSQPGIMGPMLDELRLRRGMRVLEIGAGTGYNAALIKAMVGPSGRVVAVDIDPDMARRARRALRASGHSCSVHQADGRKGWVDRAPYDRIIVTASCDGVPGAWVRQLVPGGLLELPLRLTRSTFGPQIVGVFRKESGRLRSVSVIPGGFMTLRDKPDADARDFPRLSVHLRVGGTSLGYVVSGDALAVMSLNARRRLVGVVASRSRTSVVTRGWGSRAGGLPLFAALALQRSRLVETGGWWSVGITDPTGGSVAWLATRGDIWNPGKKATVRLVARGTSTAEALLRNTVKQWRAHGRPGWEDLRIGVFHRRHRPKAWRTQTRGDATLCFDWA